MKTINRMVLCYFIFVLPLLFVAWIVWPGFSRTELTTGSVFLEWGNAVTGFLFSVWTLSALYIGLSLVLSPRFREQLLKKFVRMRERDEREELIVGKTARNVFLFNLALLILVFMLNLVQVDIVRFAPGHMIDGKGHSLNLGLNASPIVRPSERESVPIEEGDSVVFNYDFPITVSGTVMILIIANIAAFYIWSRRIERKSIL